ncbi:hypothetical protein HYH03_019055, partial [Edaphochlamys debaryana]
ATLADRFQPVFMGSAFKNRGVQLLLDGVLSYLPSPTEVKNEALDLTAGESKLVLPCSPSGPFVGLAFKLEEGKYGQLTYVRIYSGTLRKGDTVTNQSSGKKVRVPRLVRMHAAEMEDITSASAGDIVAVFGMDCASGDTLSDGVRLAMTSIKVPEPVMSLALTPTSAEQFPTFMKALQRFQKEDPTFKVTSNSSTGEIIVSGMGELHLEVYIERIRREYKVNCEVGKPKVNYREALTAKAEFSYLHKRQSGGSGQYGKVVGWIEPLPEDAPGTFEFENKLVGSAIPPEFHSSIEKGFAEAANSGALIGAPVYGVKVVLTDGAAHAVDSSEMAFRIAAVQAFRQAYAAASPLVLEPVMTVEVTVPTEYQGATLGDLNRRKGVILDSGAQGDDTVVQGDDTVVQAHVPLNNMFGYSTALRSATQGKGEFSMEYSHHAPVPREQQAALVGELGGGGGGRK